jgi:hypothetical protein
MLASAFAVIAFAGGATFFHAPGIRIFSEPARRVPPVVLSATVPSSYAPPASNEEEVWEGFPRTWVPLASVFELDPERPTPVTFLNRKYVLWQDQDGRWRAFVDACPHRLAPLSEGRIDRQANRLECAQPAPL